MNKATRAVMRKSIGDSLDQFVAPHKVTTISLPLVSVDKAIDGILDAFIQEACGNCEISCNESNCDKRHNE